jgi:hypothetical protein
MRGYGIFFFMIAMGLLCKSLTPLVDLLINLTKQQVAALQSPLAQGVYLITLIILAAPLAVIVCSMRYTKRWIAQVFVFVVVFTGWWALGPHLITINQLGGSIFQVFLRML